MSVTSDEKSAPKQWKIPYPVKDLPVLLIDDDLAFLELTRYLLENAGFQVRIAHDGLGALEALKQQPASIVVSDWMMPGLDGPSLCQAIRDQEESYHYIILLTGKNDVKAVATGLDAGADDYLVKPINRIELLARMNAGVRIINQQRKLEELNRDIARMAESDGLTGLYNRFYLQRVLPIEIKRSQRYLSEISIILCDIDHFKRVNDTYGHLAGDTVLKHFAKLLNTSIRHNIDWVARYGGEEFLIALPNTSKDGAHVVAEKIRQSVQMMLIPFDGKILQVTSSFGVAAFDVKTLSDTPVESLLQIADTNLYISKKSGRNRVTS